MAQGTQYPLNRDFLEILRLNCQHLLIKDAIGGSGLHSCVLPEDRSNLKIADVGTGTGQVALDLSRSLPNTAQIHGYDISDRLFPPAEWLPSNVTLSTWDALSEVPEHMKGQYDVVHVRFLLTIVANNDPSKLAKNLIEMLKPGGWLHWVEANFVNMDLDVVDPSTRSTHFPATDKMLVQYNKFMEARHQKFDWIPVLGMTLSRSPYDLIDARTYHYRTPSHQSPMTSASFFAAARPILPLGLDEEAAKECGDNIDRAWEEGVKNKGYLRFDNQLVVGRKPEA